ncbi:MAG: NAD(+)/NADH kinase [Acidimicrobiales bacterium]
MTTVLLVVHPERPAAQALAETARRWWEARGHRVLSPEDPELTPGEPGTSDGAAVPGSGARLEAAVPLDLAVSLGGDGTMLRTVQLAFPRQAPVLGINLGHMGYLAELEPAGMQRAFERFELGDYKVEERLALEVVVDSAAAGAPAGAGSAGGPAVRGTTSRSAEATASRGGPFLALNEVIIEKTGPGHTIRVGVDISGRRFLTYVADGLLVCTPTGSTAYNLSARGPVVSPQLRAIVLTPVAPHLVFDRSLVLSSDEVLALALLDGRPAAAVLDGSRIVPLEVGDVVRCQESKEPALLVTFGDRDFHAVLRSRFGLTDR